MHVHESTHLLWRTIQTTWHHIQNSLAGRWKYAAARLHRFTVLALPFRSRWTDTCLPHPYSTHLSHRYWNFTLLFIKQAPHYYFLDLTMLKVVKSNPTLMKMTTNKTDFKNKIFKINIIQQWFEPGAFGVLTRHTHRYTKWVNGK